MKISMKAGNQQEILKFAWNWQNIEAEKGFLRTEVDGAHQYNLLRGKNSYMFWGWGLSYVEYWVNTVFVMIGWTNLQGSISPICSPQCFIPLSQNCKLQAKITDRQPMVGFSTYVLILCNSTEFHILVNSWWWALECLAWLLFVLCKHVLVYICFWIVRWFDFVLASDSLHSTLSWTQAKFTLSKVLAVPVLTMVRELNFTITIWTRSLNTLAPCARLGKNLWLNKIKYEYCCKLSSKYFLYRLNANFGKGVIISLNSGKIDGF